MIVSGISLKKQAAGGSGWLAGNGPSSSLRSQNERCVCPERLQSVHHSSQLLRIHVR